MTTVLLTGFEPFAGDAVNPSGDAVRVVASRWAGPERLVAEILPVTFAGATARLADLIADTAPDVVIATGLAGGRSAITPERIAVNLADARIADNAGVRPLDAAVIDGAPTAYFATLPVKAIVAEIEETGIPAAVSHTAGTFVCNAAMFAALHATEATPVRAGFVHVPWSSASAPPGAPALPLEDIARALEIAIRVSLMRTTDAASPGGILS